MHGVYGNSLLKTTYGLFLLCYVFAAGGYGLTRESTLGIFEWAMGGTVVLWLLACALLRRTPKTGPAPWIASAGILLFGWFVTAVGFVDEGIGNDQLPNWDKWFPEVLLTNWSSYDAVSSLHAMERTTVLLGAMLMAIEIWRQPGWSRTLILTMIFSSFCMVIFFFLQRIVGGPFLLNALTGNTTLSFATYRYWGNAAAYLNLFWPISMAVAVFAALRQTAGWPLWLIPAASIFVANFLNLSKAGNVLAGLGLVLLGALVTPICLEQLRRAKRRVRNTHVLVALIPVSIILVSLPFAIPWSRWDYLAQTLDQQSESGRPHAYEVFAKILPDTGWTGAGPGTFELFSSPYIQKDPILRNQLYWVAHQDYLQTAIEWGYIGMALWAFVLLPPSIAIAWMARKRSERPSRDFEGYRISVVDHVKTFLATTPSSTDPCLAAGAFVAIILTALHAFVDFPMQIASLQLFFLVLIALGWSYIGNTRQASGAEE